jgi:hypothetical protein
MSVSAAHLAADLRQTWGRKLLVWWRHYNEEYLAGALRLPVVEVVDSHAVLGRWHGAERRLSIAAGHIERDPWLEVLDTLRHEMAHQYVGEVLKVDDETAHGESFRRACQKLRCSPRASGTKKKAPIGDEDRLMQRLRKVLSLAASPNEHEAEAAVQKARLLLLRYNIDMVALDAARQFSRRALGSIKGRRASYELWLALILQEFFFVETIWAETYIAVRDRAGTVLEIYGTDANLDMAAYVYDYLTHLLPPLWDTYRQVQGLDSNRERQRYWAGVLEGFYRKLQGQDQHMHREQGDLIRWKGDERLRQYYAYINPRVRVRYGRGVEPSAAYRAGLEEGRNVQIHRPVEAASNGVGGYIERA